MIFLILVRNRFVRGIWDYDRGREKEAMPIGISTYAPFVAKLIDSKSGFTGKCQGGGRHSYMYCVIRSFPL